MKQQYIQIGQFKKPFGVKGFLRFDLHQEELEFEKLMDIGVFFLKERGQFVPYFLEELQDNQGLLVKLEEVDAPEAARKLSNQAIYLKAEDLPETGRIADEQLLQFQVIDAALGLIGPLLAIEEYPEQLMGIVAYEDREILIPLSDPLIVRVDHDKQELIMDLPEGLLEL